jgi:flagellar protein FlgJ
MDAPAAISPMLSPMTSFGLDAGGTFAPGNRPTVRQAAGEMETMFLSMLLKEMRQSLGEEGGLFAGDQADVYGGLFDFYMSKHLADAGGLGLASTWAAQLEKPSRPEHAHDAPAGTNVPRTPAP